nr:uncharacterized protein LOC122273565 [Parasteatoda tepidariorum]
MESIDKERNKKLVEQMKNDIKLVKLQAEIRKNNEMKLEVDIGIQKSLAEFHEPVLHQMEKLETSRQQHLMGIKDAVDDLSLTMNDFNKTLPQIENQSEEDYTEDVGSMFLKIDPDRDVEEM